VGWADLLYQEIVSRSKNWCFLGTCI